MRKVPGKTCGYVFLPLFVEQNKGESIEDAILRAYYEDVWEVVQALSEQDEDLQVTIETLQQEKGKQGALTLGLEQYIEMTTSDTVNVALQTRLQKIIFVTILDKIGNSWNEIYGRLCFFKEKNHHCNVARSYKDKSLGAWVNTQRGLYNKQKLSENKIKLLNEIGFDWDPVNTFWQASYEALKQFKAIHNHSNVSRYKDNSLGSWVVNQRQLYSKQKLSKDKIKLLNAIGFDWDPINTNWEASYKALKQFKAIHNHSNVARSYKDKSLGNWVIIQRQLYSKQKLSENKIKLLNYIGFDWDPFNTSWKTFYNELKQFKEIHNHCNVPARYKDKSLKIWVSNQRRLYKQKKLANNRIILLDILGFQWSIKNVTAHQPKE